MRSATEPGEQNVKGQAASPAEVSAEQIRSALDKILASPGFVNADRLTRFLRFVVNSSLEGQTDKLKETLLGVEVFGRKPTYDPRIDAVVRTEAVKLRARLREYYESEGREDAVLLDLPKGGYVPAFRVREEPVEVSSPLAAAAAGALPPPTLNWRKIAILALASVAMAGSLWYAVRKGGHSGGPAPEPASIAVLPFEDLSPQHDQEYFCDGMTEEIIDALTRVGGFRVVARTSSFAFKGKQQDIREIGKKLNVAAVLEGSVRKFGNKLRVTAQLNNVADGYHLWSDTYERELKDVFSLQDEISRSIVNTLQVKLNGVKNPSHPKPENLETYDLYLKGRYHWGRWRTEGAEKALRYFEQAVTKDPGYAPAYAGLADSYCWLGFFGALPPNVGMSKAKTAALKAIELDDSLAAAHASLGYVKALYDFDWPGAAREFRRAIELNPGVDEGHFGYGIAYLVPMGKYDDAIRELKLARDLDPLSLATNAYLGLAYAFSGKGEEAMSYYRKALELDPNFVEAHAMIADSFLGRENFDAFYAELDQQAGGEAACRLGLLRATGYAIQGKRAQALAIVHQWEHPSDGSYVRATSIAGVYASLGDADQAFHWLDRAYAERDGMLAYIGKQGSFRKYRGDGRFKETLRKIGLPPD